MVEHATENRSVGGSIPSLGTKNYFTKLVDELLDLRQHYIMISGADATDLKMQSQLPLGDYRRNT